MNTNSKSSQYRFDVGDYSYSLSYLLKAFMKVIQKPHFQRDFVWKKDKRRGWIQRAISSNGLNKGYGAICTYQTLDDEGGVLTPLWLCDGFQRLSTLRELIDFPDKYGIRLSQNELWERLDGYQQTLQHRIFASHDEAFEEFRNLNIGTACLPAEYYKGELTKTHAGEYLYKELTQVVRRVEATFIRKIPGYANELKHDRDALALFYRYATQVQIKTNFGVSGRNINPSESKTPIEKELAEYLTDQRNIQDVETQLKSFEAFLKSERNLIEEVVLSASGEKGQGVSQGLFHALLHLGIYRKNIGWPVEHYKKAILELIKRTENYSGKVIIIRQDEKPKSWSFSVHDPISKAIQALEVLDLQPPPKRSLTKANYRPGYDRSELQPRSLFGDNDFFPESASINRARGAKPVDPPEQ